MNHSVCKRAGGLMKPNTEEQGISYLFLKACSSHTWYITYTEYFIQKYVCLPNNKNENQGTYEEMRKQTKWPLTKLVLPVLYFFKQLWNWAAVWVKCNQQHFWKWSLALKIFMILFISDPACQHRCHLHYLNTTKQKSYIQTMVSPSPVCVCVCGI